MLNDWFGLISLSLQEIAQNFLDGEKEVDEFITEFMTKKTLAHLRRIKSEKMKDLIDIMQPGRNFGGATNYGGQSVQHGYRPPMPTRPAPYPPN